VPRLRQASKDEIVWALAGAQHTRKLEEMVRNREQNLVLAKIQAFQHCVHDRESSNDVVPVLGGAVG